MELSRYGIDPKEIFYETFKQTPIFFCALIKNRERCVEMTNFFIQKGVDPTYKDTLKQTALYYAARENQIEMIQLLVKSGCKLNDKDEYGQTPIYYAC